MKICLLLLSFLFSVSLLGCVSVEPIYYDQEIKTADEAVIKFHRLLNEGGFEELYNLTDEGARATKSKGDFLQIMSHIRSEFGPVSTSSEISRRATSEPGATKVELIYETKFEKVTKKEKFVWIVKKKKAGLFSYEVIE